jgi:glutamate 5-kinase
VPGKVVINMRRENFEFGSDAMVVKIGSSTIQRGGQAFMDDIARQTAELIKRQDIVIVSSGARVLGEEVLKRTRAIRGYSGTLWQQFSREDSYCDGEILFNQATASIGQVELMSRWRHSFSRYDLAVAQMLYVDDQLQGVGAENTKWVLERAGMMGVPIINANDAVSSAEMRKLAIHADNDQLARRVAWLRQADTLVLLTDKDGVLDHNDQLIEFAEKAEDVAAFLNDDGDGVGGMYSKVDAAASSSGKFLVYKNWGHTRALIANGRRENILIDAARGKYGIGTWFARRGDYEW